METSHYFDIEARPKSELNIPDTFSLALKLLHQAGLPFAMAFPAISGKMFGSHMRVFGSETDLGDIQDRLASDMIDDYALIRRIKPVPASDTLECFVMVRVKSPGSRSRRRESRGAAAYGDAELQSIAHKQAALDKVPYLTAYGRSTGQNFRIYLKRTKVTSKTAGEPNGYGLSRAGNMIALPVF